MDELLRAAQDDDVPISPSGGVASTGSPANSQVLYVRVCLKLTGYFVNNAVLEGEILSGLMIQWRNNHAFLTPFDFFSTAITTIFFI